MGWSLGVSFFMILIGAPPYKLPTDNDDHFPLIQQNDIMAILKRWGRDHYINKNTEDLLNQMLQIDEDKRISIFDMENHLYFSKKKKTNKKKKMKKKKPSNPIRSNIMATYHDNDALMESPNNNHNIFQNLVMSEDDGQLFRY